jgi:hypothetical protein
MFDQSSIIVREICNGAMCVSAIILIFVFGRYVLRTRQEMPRSWYRDIAVQGALAMIVLLFGHAIRAFAGWAQFFYLDIGWDPDFWSNSNALFLTATSFVLTGKLRMIYAFSRNGTRAIIALSAAAAIVTIPLAVAAVAVSL